MKLTPAVAKGLVLKEAPAYRQKDPLEEYDPWATSSKCDDSKSTNAPNPWVMTRRKSWWHELFRWMWAPVTAQIILMFCFCRIMTVFIYKFDENCTSFVINC